MNTTTIFGTFTLWIFPLTISVGIGVGMLWAIWPVSVFPKIARTRFEVGAIALGSGLIGGRAGYVLINWDYFRKNLVEVPQIWLGGLSWIGVMAGGCLAVLIAARSRGTSFGNLADGLRPLFTSIVISAWLACWMTGIAYGVEIDAWWGIPASDEWGFLVERWPIQMIGAFSALGFHWIFDRLLVRKRIRTPGFAALLELGGFSLTIFVLSPFRGDPAPQLAGLRLDTWVSLFYVILCIVSVIVLSIKAKMIRK